MQPALASLVAGSQSAGALWTEPVEVWRRVDGTVGQLKAVARALLQRAPAQGSHQRGVLMVFVQSSSAPSSNNLTVDDV